MPRVRKGAARTQARKRLLRKARGFFGVNLSLSLPPKVHPDALSGGQTPFCGSRVSE
jgi:hypothetical protein